MKNRGIQAQFTLFTTIVAVITYVTSGIFIFLFLGHSWGKDGDF